MVPEFGAKPYLRFVPGVKPPNEQFPGDVWLLFSTGRLLVRANNGAVSLPSGSDIAALRTSLTGDLYLGTLDNRHCYCAELGDEPDSLPGGFELIDLRSMVALVDEDEFLLCGRAFQILNWDKHHRFCGKCGLPTQPKSDERARLCPQCGLLNYPRISPAIIVAVVRNNTLLLARNARFRGRFHSVLAGFVEPGESLEHCVKREVYEEAHVEVRDIRYFASQPWPFPDSLMVAFTAEYQAGELAADGVEICEANWYTADNLPDIPPKGSISRKLIDWFVANHARSD